MILQFQSPGISSYKNNNTYGSVVDRTLSCENAAGNIGFVPEPLGNYE